MYVHCRPVTASFLMRLGCRGLAIADDAIAALAAQLRLETDAGCHVSSCARAKALLLNQGCVLLRPVRTSQRFLPRLLCSAFGEGGTAKIAEGGQGDPSGPSDGA